MKKHILFGIILCAAFGCAQKSTADSAASAKDNKAPAKADAPAKSAAKAPEAAKTAPAEKAAKPAPAAAAKAAEAAAKAALAKPSPATGLPAPADVAAPPADAQKTASGLASKVLKAGTGKVNPKATDEVKVHYTGWTTDGKMFDSSVLRGQPATFRLNQVIKGWTEGVALMVPGEKRRFWIPGNLAYGDTPQRPGAPAGTLVFDVELLEIVPPQSPEEAKKAFENFLAAVKTGKEKVCACKDMECAAKSMMALQQVQPPRGEPTPEQIKILMPPMQALEACFKKLAAAAGPAPGSPQAAPAPAAKPAK